MDGANHHGVGAALPGGRLLVVTHAGVMCSTWLASGEQLADWQGTSNGDVAEVVIEDGEIRWVGLLELPGRADEGNRSIFWRV